MNAKLITSMLNSVAETLTAPTLSFSAETDNDPSTTKYSYFMIDPDVPNPDAGPLRLTFLHWAVSNAQPSCIRDQKQQTDAMYQSLTPASTQLHRYTFLVYRQPAGYVPDTVALQVRLGFDINAYAARKGLVLVGGNFLRESLVSS
jgi:phosphatidylethanolamine-binding protein